MANVRSKPLEGLCIHPDVRPEGNDVVIATGDELHRYCREKGILFLFYLGFNTNACVLLRDYGTLEMGKRGYEVIILRDLEGFTSSEVAELLELETEAVKSRLHRARLRFVANLRKGSA